MKPNDRVNRIESSANRGATVREVRGDSALIDYDEGGQGWWPLSALEAVEATGDWASFKKAMLADPGVNQVLGAALVSAPVAAMALPPSLLRAEDGNPSDFGGCWRAILATVPAAADLVPGLVTAAQAANLPDEFVGAIQGQRVRARDAMGRFIADDPATPDVDEAWV